MQLHEQPLWMRRSGGVDWQDQSDFGRFGADEVMKTIDKPERRGDWMTVSDIVRDLDNAVSQDKVRNWCRNGKIEGVLNIGDKTKAHYRVPKASWEKFKRERTGSLPAPLPTSRFRS